MLLHCIVIPKKYRFIPNILPNHKRIEKEMILYLNKNEIRKCMNDGCLVTILRNGEQIQLDETNWFRESTYFEPENPPVKPTEGFFKVGTAMIGHTKIM